MDFLELDLNFFGYLDFFSGAHHGQGQNCPVELGEDRRLPAVEGSVDLLPDRGKWESLHRTCGGG